MTRTLTPDAQAIIFDVTDKIKLALSIALGDSQVYRRINAQHQAERELERLATLSVPDRRLLLLALEQLGGAIANAQYPNTARAQFALGQKIAWGITEEQSYLDVGRYLVDKLERSIHATIVQPTEANQSERAALVMAMHLWLMEAHQTLERRPIQDMPTFTTVYEFIQMGHLPN